MALKADRNVLDWDISNICNVAAEAGTVLCYGSAGSGNALGDNAGTVTLAATPPGLTPAGMLLSNFVSIDLTHQHRNWHKTDQLLGEPAPLMRKGWATTNQVSGTPTGVQTAYLTTNGQLT